MTAPAPAGAPNRNPPCVLNRLGRHLSLHGIHTQSLHGVRARAAIFVVENRRLQCIIADSSRARCIMVDTVLRYMRRGRAYRRRGREIAD